MCCLNMQNLKALKWSLISQDKNFYMCSSKNTMEEIKYSFNKIEYSLWILRWVLKKII